MATKAKKPKPELMLSDPQKYTQELEIYILSRAVKRRKKRK